MIKLHVDFGETDDGPWLIALREDGPAVETGQLVLLVDGDRNACFGTVQKVDDPAGLIHVEPDWSTWIAHASKWEIRTALSQGAAGARFYTNGTPPASGGSPMRLRVRTTVQYTV